MTMRQLDWGKRRMLPRALVGACAVAGLLGASPALAQLGTGQSGSSTTRYMGNEEAWNALLDFGTCYARNRTPKALELVSTRAGSVEEAQAYKRLFQGSERCMRLADEMSINFLMVRGVVAEGLYRTAVPVPAALRVTSAPSVDKVTNFAEAALCFTASNRDAVQALVLKSKPGSKAEDQAITAMIPQMAECIPGNAHNSLQMDTTLIRFRLAEALWRLGDRPPPVANGGQ